ncbi:DUF4870 domain-containing protein [Ochrovirga pacifica]|uniref:DUF4870 domain-containing protein n=1 Tax=Ochrovirga pacifica TaxID=1042376 RepID=UPI0002557B4F|nr:DUF4870 domain-containing protein [Ochrovirga pacifica]
MKKNTENTNALLLHLSAFCNFIFPFGGVIVPLILWQTKKGESEFLDTQGKEVVNFNLSFLLYQTFIILCLGMVFIATFANHWSLLKNIVIDDRFDVEMYLQDHHFFIPFVFMLVCGMFVFIKSALILIGALKVKNGEAYKYPLTYTFIK